jgi:hypothetical protein
MTFCSKDRTLVRPLFTGIVPFLDIECCGCGQLAGIAGKLAALPVGGPRCRPGVR